ncbi:MAG: dihydroorotase, partial [Thiotrichaceae bacterium]
NQNEIDLMQGIESLTHKPAQILDLKSTGLAVGELADICIFDPDISWQINETTWKSRGRNTPYWQQSMQCRVTCTLQNGRVIFSL